MKHNHKIFLLAKRRLRYNGIAKVDEGHQHSFYGIFVSKKKKEKGRRSLESNLPKHQTKIQTRPQNPNLPNQTKTATQPNKNSKPKTQHTQKQYRVAPLFLKKKKNIYVE